MNKRKGFILGGVLLASAALFALAYGGVAFRKNALETRAVAYNTLDFGMRVEGSTYQYTKSYGAEGLVLNVTDGDKTDWHFGIANWSFPTPLGDDADYYCEFVMHVDVAGWNAGGASGSEVVLEAGKGGNVYKSDFAADSRFTVSKAFKASGTTTGIVLSLGSLKNAAGNNVFNACIEKFVLKEGGVDGAIVNRINFQNANGFATKWKASHDASFCASKAGVEELIYDFCALRESERRVLTGENIALQKGENVSAEIDTSKGVDGAVTTDETGAHLAITTACGEDWPARMFINTGLTLYTGEQYRVSMDLSKTAEIPFTLILDNGYWEVSHQYHFQNDGAVGHLEIDISLPADKVGNLFVKVQGGNNLGTITLNNLGVQLATKDTDDEHLIIDSVRYFANRYNIELGA